MRIYVLIVLIAVCLGYSRRNWAIALLGSIIVGAFNGHPDMPRALLGINGLSLWNAFLVCVLILFLVRQPALRYRWDIPRHVLWMFLGYVTVMLVADMRTILHLEELAPGRVPGENVFSWDIYACVVEWVLDPIKFMIPVVLLWYCCRSRRSLVWAMLAITLTMVGYVVICSRAMPITSLWSSANVLAGRRNLGEQTGLHANDLALVLVTGFWTAVALVRALEHQRLKWFCRLAAVGIFVAILMCRSRGGYLAMVASGLVIVLVRYRTLLPWLVIGSVVALAIPNVAARIMTGFNTTEVAGSETTDWDNVSAGRTTTLWPPVLDAISASPLIGYGRLGILHEPCASNVTALEGHIPDHPHNQYLELLLDSGVLGLIITLTFMATLLGALFRASRSRDPILAAAGVAGLGALVAYLVAGVSGHTLYFTDRTFLIWCCMAIGYRSYQISESGARTGTDRHWVCTLTM